jgi:hypothetical protein
MNCSDFWTIIGLVLNAIGALMAGFFSWKGDATFWKGFPWWIDKPWISGTILSFAGYSIMILGFLLQIYAICLR